MIVLSVIIAMVFAMTFLNMPLLGAGWFWDLGNALGLLAYAGLLFQMIPGRPKGRLVKRHEWLGYATLALGGVHAFWFLLGDGAVHVYLQPGAPAYMWLGLAALILLGVLTVLARMPERMRVHSTYRVFKQVHRWLGVGLVVAAALHIALSGFYLSVWWQVLLLAGATGAACFGRPLWTRLKTPPAASGRLYLMAGSAAVLVFVLIRDLTP